MAREFFVISCNEKGAQRWRQVHPRLGHPFEVRGRSVKEITGNEDHVRSEAQEHMDDTLRETVAPDMSKVHIADQGCHSSPPRFWEVRKLYGDSSHANKEGIDDGVRASKRGDGKKQKRDRLFVEREAKKHCRSICKPG